jgi:hypothetical protein
MIEPDIELNATVARDVMRWTALGAHLWQDRQTSTVYYTGHDPTRVFMPHMVFNPSSDPLHVVWIEEQVERLGKRDAYLDTLIQEVGLDEHDVTMGYTTGYPAPARAPVVQQVLLQATPVQRCRAAVQVMRDADYPSGAQPKV